MKKIAQKYKESISQTRKKDLIMIFIMHSYMRRPKNYHSIIECHIITELEIFMFLGFFWLYIPVNSYGHVWRVSSPNHTFFLGKLEQAVNRYFMNILSLITNNNPS